MSGVRIKDQAVKNADAVLVEKAFTSAGFSVTEVTFSARALIVKAKLRIDGCGCGPYRISIKITDAKTLTVGWVGISPRDYYHLDGSHASIYQDLKVKADKAWAEYLERTGYVAT